MSRVLAFFAVLAIALTAAASATGLSAPTTIRATAVGTSLTPVDLGQRGFTVGDAIVGIDALYAPGRNKPIGHLENVCTVIGVLAVRLTPDAVSALSCQFTAYFPNGKLVLAAAFHIRPLVTMAVLGGTGVYANARGTLEITNFAAPKSQLVFRLRP